MTEWNRKLVELTGYSLDEALGKLLVDEFITSAYHKDVHAVLARAMKGVDTDNFEFSLGTKTGKQIRLLLNAATRRDATGQVIGVVGVGQDITKLRHMMEQKSQVRGSSDEKHDLLYFCMSNMCFD